MIKKYQLQIHSVSYVILSISGLLLIIVNNNVFFNIIMILFTLINVTLTNKFSLKVLFYLIILLIPLSVGIYGANLVFMHSNNSELALYMISRTIAITVVSILYLYACDFEEFVYFIMQKNKYTILIGYSLLSAFYATKNLYHEYQRIQYAYIMRFAKYKLYFNIFYPLLISGARYALSNGLSMESRGLNINKTFIHPVRNLYLKDYLFCIVNVIIMCYFFKKFN